jgi:hypothetical protein
VYAGKANIFKQKPPTFGFLVFFLSFDTKVIASIWFSSLPCPNNDMQV